MTATDAAGPAGNVYPKYATRNPIARHLVEGFLAAFTDLAEITRAAGVLEVGCGEGHLCEALARPGRLVRGVDISPEVIAEAGQRAGAGVQLGVASVYDLSPPRDAADLVVCCEVLEHLAEPDRALAILAGLARPWLLVSVPQEPLWRVLNMLRGKYLGALGNTPGHVQHWSRRGFLDMLARHVDIVAVRTPLPWTMALCRSRAGSPDA